MRNKEYWGEEDEFTLTGKEIDSLISLVIRECADAWHWEKRLDMPELKLQVRKILDGDDSV